MGVKILNVSSSAQNCTRIQGPFPKKIHAFFIKAMHHCKHSSFYLPNMKKILWDISSNTEKINVRLALFLDHKPQNLPSNSHFNLFNSHHPTFMSELFETINKNTALSNCSTFLQIKQPHNLSNSFCFQTFINGKINSTSNCLEFFAISHAKGAIYGIGGTIKHCLENCQHHYSCPK